MGHASEDRARRCRVAAGLLAPALLLVWPLLARQATRTPPAARPQSAQGERDGADGGGGESAEGADDLVARDVAPRTPLAASARLEGNDRERSAPALVALPDGGAWLVDREWRAAAGDFIVAQQLTAAGAVEATIELTPTPASRDAPSAAWVGKRDLVVVWSEVVAGVPQLCGARLDSSGVPVALTLTSGSAPARDPEIAVASDGTAWIAWEQWVADEAHGGGSSDGGSFDVVAAPLVGDQLGATVVVGSGKGSDLDPVLARAGDTLWIAWVGFVERDYEVLTRPLAPLGEARAISAESQADDLHPALAGAADGTLWIAWDRLIDSRRGTSLPAELSGGQRVEASVHVQIARLRGGVVEETRAGPGWGVGEVPGAPLLGWGGGVPRLAVDASGRPWIVHRFNLQSTARDRRSGSPLLVQWFEAGGWSQVFELEESAGLCDAGAIVAIGDGVMVAAQADRRLKTGSLWNAVGLPAPQKQAAAAHGDEFATWTGPSALVVATHTAAAPSDSSESSEGAAPPDRAPLVWKERPVRREVPHFHPAGAAADDPFVSGAKRHEVTRGATTWKVWYGDLHRHTSLSRCSRGIEPLPEDRYAFARDVYGDDFLAVTDHAGHLDPSAWARLCRQLAFEATPTLLPLAGYECSTQAQGHVNVVFAEADAPLLAVASNPKEGSLQWLAARLAGRQALVIPHTSADPGRRVDFADCDPRLTRLVEVYQSLRGSFEFEGCWRQAARALAPGSFAVDALRALPQVGFIASSDHGNGAAYAGVLAERLDAESVFAALSAGRVFATTLRGLVVELRIGDAVMGESIDCSDAPTIHVAARMTQPIRDVLVLKDGRPWRRLGRDRESAQAESTIHFELAPESIPPRVDFTLTVAVEGGKLGVASGDGDRKRDPTRPTLENEDGVLRFTWPKGVRNGVRDGYRGRLRASADAVLQVQAGSGAKQSIPLAKAQREGISGKTLSTEWRLSVIERHDLAVAEQTGLGVAEVTHEWRDDELAAGTTATYYVRVIQADGETVWSSPIRVRRR
ncbi:MAG: hypothetical protein EXS13_01525 [Planctomycetes bacterium]|nr:hypothetical protein [Planctomycetota bacterium]